MWALLLMIDAGAAPPEGELGGYVETFWSWNFDEPDPGVTNLRGFDNRHDTISISNAAVALAASKGDASARLVLQTGLTPSTYYLAEPRAPAVSGVGPSGPRLWRNLQEAWGAWQATDDLTVDAGLFLSPIGIESIAAKDDWNFSRSDLFYGLPFYHAGARVHWQASDTVRLTGSVCNGWNAVLDDNPEKSLFGQLHLEREALTGSLVYFVGVERPDGAREGAPWRHMLDLWARVAPSRAWSVQAQVNGGVEPGELGTAWWVAAAGYARVRVVEPVFLAARGDVFVEHVPQGASPIFWPAEDDGTARIGSGTLTLDLRPTDGVSLRLEGRYDAANTPMFLGGAWQVDPVSGLPVFDERGRATATVAAIVWF